MKSDVNMNGCGWRDDIVVEWYRGNEQKKEFDEN